jgi:hypothetical protein
VHAVEEFADGDDADRPVLITDRVLDLRISDTALKVYEQLAID